jgi:uncharacterized protein YjgD (DUF1641 family)
MTGNDENNGSPDTIEELLILLMKEKDQIAGLATIFKDLVEAGTIQTMLELIGKVSPSNIEYLAKMLGSYNMKVGLYKTLNLIPAIFSALSDEGTSDVIKAIAFESDTISEKMIDGAKNPQKLTLLHLLALGKDPDFAAGATAMINMLSTIGKAISRVRE